MVNSTKSPTLTTPVVTLTVLFIPTSIWASTRIGVILSLLLERLVSISLPVTLTAFSIIPVYAGFAIIIKIASDPLVKLPIYQV